MMNVRTVDRDQLLLMPPSLSEWLPPDHLAWLIIDVVAELDLAGFYRLLRADGRGGASYDPEVMLGILLYAYCIGERSSRRIELAHGSSLIWNSLKSTPKPSSHHDEDAYGQPCQAKLPTRGERFLASQL